MTFRPGSKRSAPNFRRGQFEAFANARHCSIRILICLSFTRSLPGRHTHENAPGLRGEQAQHSICYKKECPGPSPNNSIRQSRLKRSRSVAMQVAAVQYKPTETRPEDALLNLLQWTAKAANTADLVVLPEMALTGYHFPDRQQVASLAEPADGPTFQALSPLAQRHEAWIVAGFPERDGDSLYNSAMVVGPTGELRGTYRKTMLFASDMHWATPGNGDYPLFECMGLPVTVGICMDLNDDRFIAHCRREEPRVIAFPTNWVDEGTIVWPYWAARIQGLPSALVAANSYGDDGPLSFTGRSAILDQRTLLAAAPYTGDAIIAADIAP
jgi:predicted amidohydrolase